MTWEQSAIFTTNSHIEQDSEVNDNSHIESQLYQFLRNYRTEDGVGSIREQIQSNLHSSNPSIVIDIDAFMGYDKDIGHKIFNEPERMLDLFEKVVYDYAKEFHSDVLPMQVLFTTNSEPVPLRNIESGMIRKLIVIPGLVISTTPVSSIFACMEATPSIC